MPAIELIGVGNLMGIIHVLTGPDHLSAIATLSGINVSSRSSSSCSDQEENAFLLGIKWGIGHSLGLLVVVGVFIATGQLDGEAIVMDDSWSIILEGIVGVFMLTLGSYGLHNAFRNRKADDVGSVLPLSSSATNLKKLNEDGDLEDGQLKVEIQGMPKKFYKRQRSGSGNSLAHMMEEVLVSDSRHGNESLLTKNSDKSIEEGNDGDKYPTKLKTSTSGLSESFVKYQADKPSLMKAKVLVVKHASPEKSIVLGAPSSSDRPNNGRDLPGILAIAAGALHGAAGPGGVLGVMPAVQMRDVKSATIYLSTFFLTSALVMGCFAACCATLGQWLVGSGRRGSSRVFRVEAGSAFLSIVVGITWLALLSIGKVEEVYAIPYPIS
mmetsp:Transcript_27276/g.56870  ORF Transcript_27276/g.56870 Transcript_27276/m.56870 type:complete len:382 (-) Transcript_27276:85-1230(-)